MALRLVALALPAVLGSRHIQSLYGKGGYDSGGKWLAEDVGAPQKSMAQILGEVGHYNEKLRRPVDALVIFHLEDCPFCQIELGTVEYSYDNHEIFNLTGVRPFHLFVDTEGPGNLTSSYCIDHPDCIEEAKTYLGVDVTAIKGFPTTYFYDSKGEGAEVGDTPCGVAVRGASLDVNCAYWNSTVIKNCAAGETDMSNWICNLKTVDPAPPPLPPSTGCAMPETAWERCRKSD